MLEGLMRKASNFDFSNIRLAIVYGGEFEESEISRLSFVSIAKTLRESDFCKIDAIEYSNHLVEDLKKSNPHIVLNMMHGEFGEDGGLPTICEMLGIKCTHSDKFASCIGMRKDISKMIFKENGLDVARSVKISKSELNEAKILEILNELSITKCAVKPYDGGSSIGVSICDTNNIDLSESMKSKSEYFLVEEFIKGDDFSVPVLKSQAIDIVQISTSEGFYDYKNKYNAETNSRHVFPANIPDEIRDKMKKYAEIAHNALGCKTLSRSDFIYDADSQRVVILEINTHPGMTATSIFPEIALYYGIDFQTLLKIIIYDGYFA